MINLSQIGDNGIVYNGVPLSDYFVVRGVDMPLLPTIDTTSLKIDGKAGAWFTSRQIGTRDITVRLGMLEDTKDRITSMEDWIMVSDLLAKDKEHRLDLGNGYYVNAVMTGDSDITRNMNWSTADVTFRCFDPFIYGETHTETLKTGDNVLHILGKYPTFPVFELDGINGTFTLTDKSNGKMVRVHNLLSDAKLTIDMEQFRCLVRSSYKAADPSVSDFWPINTGEVTLNLSAGSGTMTYTERYL